MKFASFLETQPRQLDEHLGNLNAIKKELLPHLMSKIAIKSQSAGPIEHEKQQSTGEKRYSNRVSNGLGRDSELINKKLKYTEILDELVPEDVAAVVVLCNGKQVAIFSRTEAIQYTLSKGFLNRLGKTIMTPKGDVDVSNFIKETMAIGFRTTASLKASTSSSEAKKILALIAYSNHLGDMPKTDAKIDKLDVIIIKKDQKRKEIHQARAEAIKGRVVTPKDPSYTTHKTSRFESSYTAYTTYTNSLKAQLEYKLNKLKNERSIKVDNVDEFLNSVIEKGYLDKITFKDTVFNLKTSNVNMNDLMLKHKGKGESYVEYENSDRWGNGRKNYELKKEAEQIAIKEMAIRIGITPEQIEDTTNLSEEEMKALIIERKRMNDGRYNEIILKHGVIPDTIKIMLVLDKSSIVPFKILVRF